MNKRELKRYILSISVTIVVCFITCGIITTVGYRKIANESLDMLSSIPLEYKIMYTRQDDIISIIGDDKLPISVVAGTFAATSDNAVFNIRASNNDIYTITFDRVSGSIDASYLYTDEPYWFKEDYLQILSAIREQDETVKEFDYLLQTFDSQNNVESITVETNEGSQYVCRYNKDDEVVNIQAVSEE